MKPAVYTTEAKADLKLIWGDSVKRFGLQQADSLRARIDETMRTTILAFPNSGRLRPELGHGVRSFPIVPFVVFHRVDGKNVVVLRVLHGRRDIREPLLSLLVAV